MYNIDCKCEYCDLSNAKALAESDQRRKEIQEFHTAFNPRFKTMSLDNMIKALLHALVSISKEGLWAFEPIYLETLAMIYYELGDQRNLRRWAEKAIDAYRATDSKVNVLRWQLVLLGGPYIDPTNLNTRTIGVNGVARASDSRMLSDCSKIPSLGSFSYTCLFIRLQVCLDHFSSPFRLPFSSAVSLNRHHFQPMSHQSSPMAPSMSTLRLSEARS